MIFPSRLTKLFTRKKTQEELDEYYKNVELEKGDFFAMVIAAIITFMPIVIISMAFIYGLIWLFAVR
ncbi:MAG: hypothetical protein FWE82_06265 [Defluviitaleaceae bacterium]|nr:hypothetical protein [Defluviitaleaceae bacterium]